MNEISEKFRQIVKLLVDYYSLIVKLLVYFSLNIRSITTDFVIHYRYLKMFSQNVLK
jgi:hypothetical protein